MKYNDLASKVQNAALLQHRVIARRKQHESINKRKICAASDG